MTIRTATTMGLAFANAAAEQLIKARDTGIKNPLDSARVPWVARKVAITDNMTGTKPVRDRLNISQRTENEVGLRRGVY